MLPVPPFLLVGRYDIAEEIGRGGHAIVFRARDRVLDRDVAVKVLRDDAISSDTLVRFRQEVQVTAQLEHAHILHVYDTGEFEGRPYIVMELASGRTLNDRLEREGQLPIADAMQIARDVGLALAHAHARGVVHRDVKPDNILLGPGGAILSDFGIARVTSEEIARKITSTGTAVGTLQYMSPEQLCAEPNIDARSDQYALACVLYEMLAGVRPHVAATFHGLRILRVTGQHLPVRAHRPSVSPTVNQAILTAMSSMVADRFRNMDEFLTALGFGASGEFHSSDWSETTPASGEHGVMGSSARGRLVTPRVDVAVSGHATRSATLRMISLVALVAVAAAGLTLALREQRPSAVAARGDGALEVSLLSSGGASPDTTTPSHHFHAALRLELQSWDAIRLVDRAPRSGSASLTITPTVSKIADSVRLQLDLQRSVDSGGPMSISVMVPASAMQTSAPLAASLVRQALLRYTAPDLHVVDVPGLDRLPGRSLPALQAFARGFAAMRTGHMDSAAAFFRTAARVGSSFALAEFWAAQSGMWAAPQDVALWQSSADNAVRAGTLRGVDSLLAVGVQQLTYGRYPEACTEFRAATARDPGSFAGWYGLGDCQRFDSLVVRRPEGYRFRSSHWSALDAYRHAVDVAPTSEWLSALFVPVMRMTYAMAGNSRAGHTGRVPRDAYYALPSLESDTIGFIPLVARDFNGMGQRAVPRTLIAALRRGRVVARETTARWITRFPDSPDAWFQRALALELDGHIAQGGVGPTAEAALDKVASGTISPTLRANLVVARTRLALRRGDVQAAMKLARGATRAATTESQHVQATLAPLAALLGDVALATQLSAGKGDASVTLPSAVSDSLNAFFVQATIGECRGLEARRTELDRFFRSSVAIAELEEQRARWLRPVYRSAVPCLGPDVLKDFAPILPLDSAFVALAVGNRKEARRVLDALRASREGATFSTISWDYLFAESWALAQAADTVNAKAQLIGALEDIASMSMYTLHELPQAAGLRRGMLLLRDIAAQTTSRGSERLWVMKTQSLTSTESQERRK